MHYPRLRLDKVRKDLQDQDFIFRGDATYIKAKVDVYKEKRTNHCTMGILLVTYSLTQREPFTKHFLLTKIQRGFEPVRRCVFRTTV